MIAPFGILTKFYGSMLSEGIKIKRFYYMMIFNVKEFTLVESQLESRRRCLLGNFFNLYMNGRWVSINE